LEFLGVNPPLIPGYLALVGDAADGYPGIRGIGPRTAAALLNRHGPIEDFPPEI
jgi:5'-3' exonuclease